MQLPITLLMYRMSGLFSDIVEKMETYPLIVFTFHPSIVMLLSADLTYNKLNTHLSLGRLGHGSCDHHKAPQHIEPGEIKNRG